MFVVVKLLNYPRRQVREPGLITANQLQVYHVTEAAGPPHYDIIARTTNSLLTRSFLSSPMLSLSYHAALLLCHAIVLRNFMIISAAAAFNYFRTSV